MKKFTTIVASSVLAAGLFLQPTFAAMPVALDGEKLPSLAPMLKEVTPGVVTISVAGTQRTRQRVPEMFRYFFGPGAPREQVQEKPFQGMGSGVIIDAEEGYVVTNNHVIANADEITVTLKMVRNTQRTPTSPLIQLIQTSWKLTNLGRKSLLLTIHQMSQTSRCQWRRLMKNLKGQPS